MASSEQQKVGKEFMKLINAIRIQAMKEGRKVPSVRVISDQMAKTIKGEDKLFNEIIRFR